MPLLTEIEYVLDISETVRFYSTPEIPIHHISAILLSHFTTTKIPLLEDNIDLNIRYRQQLKMNYISFANNVIDLTTSYLISLHDLENTTGITNVIIPGYYRHDAVSKLGLIYYREAAVIFDEKNDPKMRQLEIALLIGRSITYQFFRNCISNSWSYMWLNHGLTTLLALDAIDENFPEFHIKDLFVVQTLQESLRFDDDFIMKPLISDMKSPETELLSASYYLKAPSILRMLQHMLSSYVFEKGIKIYLSRNPVLEEPIDSFWTAMQSVYDASALNHRIYESSVKQLMDAWTKQQHYPIVEVTFDSHVTVSAENMNSTNEEKWWIPYTTVTNRNDKPDFSLLLIHFDLRFLSVGDDIFLPDKVETNWTIINVQQIGYYRVFYDESILNLIREYLFMHEHINKIHVLNRAQIIDDAFYFFMKNKISLRAFLELTEYLRKEKNFIAWYPMFKSLEYMSTFFHYRHSSYMKTSMMRTVNDLFVLINDDSSFSLNYLKDSLKEEISRWACVLGSSECKAEANSKLKTHLKEKNIILPWWKKWTYCNGLMIADNNTWFSALLHIDYTERSNYKIFEYLTCSENFLFIRHYIDFIESSETMNDTAKDYSQILIFHSIIARHAKNDTMLDYLLANLHKIPRYFYSKIYCLNSSKNLFIY
ncbi:Aminopeptidase N [Cyphomyrmex costatus]|uniref:Aminopeptidase N n=1 Tax=Cyphomyrmex costatus TaxID=456900 RepID=A0A151ICW0_9HYME|nr:Aminopeptidase N [Cyphomyrmex costatus]